MSASHQRKDVDGFHPYNVGRLNVCLSFALVRPKGIITLLDRYNIDLRGKHAVVVGALKHRRPPNDSRTASKVVRRRHATVLPKTWRHVRQADVVVVAVGA
ncbi:hypothetical protein OH492_06445 [Vibrio chagasii]|nr:hypothetical protein [Vibrio chagasii]